MKKILVFGEVIWDIYDKEKVIGGAALNFAAHMARCGQKSYLLSGIGQDELGETALSLAHDFGVTTDYIQKTDRPTGACLVRLDDAGVPSYQVLQNTAFDSIDLTDKDIAALSTLSADALYFGTLIQRSPLSRASIRKLCHACHFKNIICDINLRPDCYDRDSVLFCLEEATILKVSEEEEPLLRDMGLYHLGGEATHLDIAKALCQGRPNLTLVIITLGEKGCYVYSPSQKTGFYQDAVKTKVASTVGAGDSFIAAFTACYLETGDAKLAARLGSIVSSYVVSKTEAIPPYTLQNGTLVPGLIRFFDMHVHSCHSHDSDAKIADHMRAAEEKGISALAVTDHFDVEFLQEKDIFTCIDDSVADVAKHAESTPAVLAGVEVGEGIWHLPQALEMIQKHPYDVVLGSVHAVRYPGYTMPYSKIDFSDMPQKTLEEYMSLYFDEVLETVKQIPMDVLAHLTCPLRYIIGKYHRTLSLDLFKGKIDEILHLIIQKGIALEVNTSCDDLLMPNEAILQKYRDMGGCLITLGSDAHIPQNIGKNFEKAQKVLTSLGFDTCYYFRGRAAIPYKIETRTEI